MHRHAVRLSLALLTLSAACAANVSDNAPVDPTTFAIKVSTVDTELFRAVWMTAGMDDPSACPAVREAVVTFTDFQAAGCSYPSCYDPNFKAGSGYCDWACTAGIDNAAPVMIFAAPVDEDHWVAGHSELTEQAHETFHTWLWCLTGDMDFHHTNKLVWTTMMATFKSSAAAVAGGS